MTNIFVMHPSLTTGKLALPPRLLGNDRLTVPITLGAPIRRRGEALSLVARHNATKVRGDRRHILNNPRAIWILGEHRCVPG